MKNIIITENNLNPHFIGSWTIEPLSICDEIINYFELNSSKQRKGQTTYGVNPNVKDSIDMRITPKEILSPGNEIFKLYFEKLFKCYKLYIEEWPFSKDLAQGLARGIPSDTPKHPMNRDVTEFAKRREIPTTL